MLEQHYPLWKTTNLVINPGNIPSCLARFIRKTNFSREWIRRLFLPHRKVSPFYFSPTWTFPFVYRAGFRSLLTFLPPLRPCLPAFPSPSRGSNKSRPSGTFIIRAEKRWAKIQRRRETGGNLLLLLLLGENLSRRR